MMQYPKLVESKTSTNKVVFVEWNPAMDLLATVFANGTLTCSRLLSLQRVWHQHSLGKVIDVAWRPDGRVLAILAVNEKKGSYQCTIHDVENGKQVHSISRDEEITTLAWFQIAREDKCCDPISQAFSHKLAQDQNNLNILTIATIDSKISFYALGLFYLGDIDIKGLKGQRVSHIHMSECFRYLTTNTVTELCISTLTISVFENFQDRSIEILTVAKLYAKITKELEYLDDTVNAITMSWADVLAGLDNKLSSYCSRRDGDFDTSSFIGADALLELLVLGHPCETLEKFLTDMSDKGLKKLNTAIEQTCMRVQNLIVKNAIKCCFHLHEDLVQLREMILSKDKYRGIGLDNVSIVEAIKAVGSLVLKLTELQQVVDHSLKSTQSFFKWLISIACRLTGEQNNTLQAESNKTTQQDIQLIRDFIVENFDEGKDLLAEPSESSVILESSRPTCSNFTLEQVGQYLKNESLSRLKHSFAKPDTNFWIDFVRARPELTETKSFEEGKPEFFLFYRHNPDTSLIQEHKSAILSITKAFEAVPTNFQNVFRQTPRIVFDDFTKAAYSSRTRIEFDTRTSIHMTLFATKCQPSKRSYFIAQNLLNDTFKIISIEFIPKTSSVASGTRSSTSNQSSIWISDHSFYESKESKKMLITFLLVDRTLNDTMIVQVPAARIIDQPSCVDRNYKEISRIFRSCDTLDKNSSRVILKLDLCTDTNQVRNHEPPMMMKRIKSTYSRDLFTSSGRGVIAFTSSDNKRLHLYEMESMAEKTAQIDDEPEADRVDESLIDADIAD